MARHRHQTGIVPWVRVRTGIEEDMTRRTTRHAQANLDHQQATGTHRPATECACGTWRTPGISHVAGNAETHLGVVWCSK